MDFEEDDDNEFQGKEFGHKSHQARRRDSGLIVDDDDDNELPIKVFSPMNSRVRRRGSQLVMVDDDDDDDGLNSLLNDELDSPLSSKWKQFGGTTVVTRGVPKSLLSQTKYRIQATVENSITSTTTISTDRPDGRSVSKTTTKRKCQVIKRQLSGAFPPDHRDR